MLTLQKQQKTQQEKALYEAIENYFVLGDLHTAALVSRDGSVDWMCVPYFDDASIFARILDPQGGRFALDSSANVMSAGYLKDTAVLQLDCQQEENIFTIRDFMVPQESESVASHFLVRKFQGKRGKAKVKLVFEPRPDYARQPCPKLKRSPGKLSFKIDEWNIWLHLPEDSIIEQEKDGYHIEFTLPERGTAYCVLEYTKDAKSNWKGEDLERATRKFWQKWISQGTFFEFCRDELVRSAITLKLMQFYPTGAIVAAPTTSLPEAIGGVRNWDYRFTWIRDTTFTLYAFYILGYTAEAQRFFSFLEKVATESEENRLEVSLFYTIHGKRVPHEQMLNHLKGYEESAPVRVGNGATDQFQLDIYGSLIDAYYFMSKRGLVISPDSKRLILSMVEHITSFWQQSDNGIWEIRDTPQNYTYSKVMAWVGIDRALRLADRLEVSAAKIAQWEKLRTRISEWIWKHSYNEELGTFTQHPNTTGQDATNFFLLLVQFIDRDDPRARSLLEKTKSELMHRDTFVYRYLRADGLPGNEGAFLLCSYWMISALAFLGETEDAKKLFECLSERVDHEGLLPEEIDPDTYRYLGNFPQAFSHVGHVMSAWYIYRYTKEK